MIVLWRFLLSRVPSAFATPHDGKPSSNIPMARSIEFSVILTFRGMVIPKELHASERIASWRALASFSFRFVRINAIRKAMTIAAHMMKPKYAAWRSMRVSGFAAETGAMGTFIMIIPRSWLCWKLFWKNFLSFYALTRQRWTSHPFTRRIAY